MLACSSISYHTETQRGDQRGSPRLSGESQTGPVVCCKRPQLFAVGFNATQIHTAQAPQLSEIRWEPLWLLTASLENKGPPPRTLLSGRGWGDGCVLQQGPLVGRAAAWKSLPALRNTPFQQSLSSAKLSASFIPSWNELHCLAHFKTALEITETLIKDEKDLMPALKMFSVFPQLHAAT